MVGAGRVDKRRRPAPTVAGALPTVIVTVASAIAAIGFVMALNQLGTGQAPSTTETLGGLTVQVNTSGWLSDDHHGDMPMAGYQMPGQMMPGMPEGDRVRLSIPITLRNTSGSPRGFTAAAEFRLVGGQEAGAQAPTTDTFGAVTRLHPDTSVNGVLYFDVLGPATTDRPFRLEWARDGGTVRLPVPALGTAPPPAGYDTGHEHG